MEKSELIAFFVWILTAYICVVSAVVSGGLAKRYDRDVIGWSLIGFVAGPLSVAVLFAIGSLPPVSRYSLSSDDRRRWSALLRLDNDLAEAAKQARAHSVDCERDFAGLFFAANDRRAMTAALKAAIGAAISRGETLRESTKA